MSEAEQGLLLTGSGLVLVGTVLLLVDPANPTQAELVGTARSVRLAVLPLVGSTFVLGGLALAGAGATLPG